MDSKQLKNIVEAALLAADRPLSVDALMQLFQPEDPPPREEVKQALLQLEQECEHRGIELKLVASGYRYQTRESVQQFVSRLWRERPPRYSRALLETLALIVYRQPITRAEIEDIRGVSISSNIIKALLEREWVKIVGHKEVPGRPAMYGTTKKLLDYFNLKSLDDLPSLAQLTDFDVFHPELELEQQLAEVPAAVQLEVIAGGSHTRH